MRSRTVHGFAVLLFMLPAMLAGCDTDKPTRLYVLTAAPETAATTYSHGISRGLVGGVRVLVGSPWFTRCLVMLVRFGLLRLHFNPNTLVRIAARITLKKCGHLLGNAQAVWGKTKMA